MAGVRLMREADVRAVKEVVYEVFHPVIAQYEGEVVARGFHPRAEWYIRSRIQQEPQGCFVAEDESGRVVGTCFSFVWGSLGWFGSLTLRPESRGGGLARELLEASLSYMRSRGCADLGLETRANTHFTVGLYIKYGFKPGYLTWKLRKEIDIFERPPEHSGDLSVNRYHALETPDRTAVRLAVREFGSKIMQGLDYSGEIELAERLGTGDTLVLFERGRPIGFALCLIRPMQEEESTSVYVRILAMDPDHSDPARLGLLLGKCEEYAAAQGRRSLVLDVNSRYWRGLSYLLERGYRLVHQTLRMSTAAERELLVADRYLYDFSLWQG